MNFKKYTLLVVVVCLYCKVNGQVLTKIDGGASWASPGVYPILLRNNSNATLTENHHTVVYNLVTLGNTVTLPAAADVEGRVYVIVNRSASTTLDLSSSYFTIAGGTSTTVPPGNSITVQSNGTSWYQIR